jgi:hypothetical protein
VLLRISTPEQVKETQAFWHRERFPYRTSRMRILHVRQNQPNGVVIILSLCRNFPYLGHQWDQRTLLFKLLFQRNQRDINHRRSSHSVL